MILPTNASQCRGFEQCSVPDQFQEGVLAAPLERGIGIDDSP